MNFVDPWVKQDSRQQSSSASPNTTTTVTNGSETTPISDGAPSSTSREQDTTYTAAGPFGSLEFEDNFDPHPPLNPREPQDNRLPDSDNYLAALEKRLDRLKHNPSVLQQLADRREACMRSLLTGSVTLRSEEELALDEPVVNSELLRFIQPVQALSQAEIVRLVQHDQLQQEADEELLEESREGEESGTESSTSR
uniref:Uncharacterized protein n=1 Tax=Anopheles darlingi TaxID=43151 RepID=A0A2M4CGY6_ANODA